MLVFLAQPKTQRDVRKLLKGLDTFITLIVVIITEVYAYVQTYHIIYVSYV